MGREWKPGDVAIIENDCIVIRAKADCAACKDIPKKTPGDHWHAPHMRLGHGYDDYARPLVVIDPEDDETVRKFAAWTADGDYADWRLKWVQTFLRSLIEPPKPEEPTGLGAVVADAEGLVWLRSFGDVGYYIWSHHSGDTRKRYQDISAVRVLSEGVTP